MVVLPAPSSPIRRTTAGGFKTAGDLLTERDGLLFRAVRNTRALIHGLRQKREQVGGDQRPLSHGFRAEFPGQTVEIDSRGDGRFRLLGSLCQKTGQHAGEDVAAAAGGHGGRPGGIDPDPAIREGDQTCAVP